MTSTTALVAREAVNGVYRAGRGDPLVLIHGFTDTWRGWTPLFPHLEEKHEVIAVTLPGHLGGAPWDPATPLTMPAVADLVERQLDALGVARAHFAGCSLGGWLSLMMAARGRARSVVAVCPGGGWEPHSPEERAVASFFRRSVRLLRWSRALHALIARVALLRAIAMRDYIAHPARVPPEGALHLMRGALGCAVADAVLARIDEPDATFGDLDPIPAECRVRILYGTRDRIVRWPTHYVRMRRTLPDAEWIALEGMGHLAMWDDPAHVARLILDVTA